MPRVVLTGRGRRNQPVRSAAGRPADLVDGCGTGVNAKCVIFLTFCLLDAIQRIPPTHIVHGEEDGSTLDYQACALFIQVINHGVEHRTNITTILSGLGLPAPEVDGWGYLFSHPDRFEMKEDSQ